MIPSTASPTALPRLNDPEKHAAMLALAEQLLAGREAHRAKLVEEGKPIGASVEESIRLGRALVDQWRWAVDPAAGELPLPDWPGGWWGAWPHELEADAFQAADRARQRAAGGDAEATALAERCEALAWYQYRESRASGLGRIVEMVGRARLFARIDVERAAGARQAA